MFEGRDESKVEGQWVQAKYLKVGDKVLLSDGKTAIIKKLVVEHLSEPETTYNFEVADFHTYYVGEQGILVHNACPKTFDVMQFDDAAVAEARAGDPTFGTFKKRLFAAQERLNPGTFDAGTTNVINSQKVILHHPLGRAGTNLYNVVGVTQSQHLAIHAITGYRNAVWSAVNYNLGAGVFW